MKLADYLRHTDTDRVAFAQLVGVDAVSIGRYVTGERRPTWRVLHRIRDVTGGRVTADDFMDPPAATTVKTDYPAGAGDEYGRARRAARRRPEKGRRIA